MGWIVFILLAAVIIWAIWLMSQRGKQEPVITTVQTENLLEQNLMQDPQPVQAVAVAVKREPIFAVAQVKNPSEQEAQELQTVPSEKREPAIAAVQPEKQDVLKGFQPMQSLVIAEELAPADNGEYFLTRGGETDADMQSKVVETVQKIGLAQETNAGLVHLSISLEHNISEASRRYAELNRMATQSGSDEAVKYLLEAKKIKGDMYEETRLAKFLQQAGRFDEAIQEIDWLVERVPLHVREETRERWRLHSSAMRLVNIYGAAELICSREDREDLHTQYEQQRQEAEELMDRLAVMDIPEFSEAGEISTISDFKESDLERAFLMQPEIFLVALQAPPHQKYLSFYQRVYTLRKWLDLGFGADFRKQGHWVTAVERDLYKFREVYASKPTEHEALLTGKRLVEYHGTMLDYARIGIPFDDFISHPKHFNDFCLGSLAHEKGNIAEAIQYFGQAVSAAPEEVRYGERWFELRIQVGDLSAPREELAYFAHEIDSIIHTGRVYSWVKLQLKHKDYAEAAWLLRRVAQLLEDKIAGKLPTGRYAGDRISYVIYKRDQFRKKLSSWSRSTRYAPLMREIERQGGLPPVEMASVSNCAGNNE